VPSRIESGPPSPRPSSREAPPAKASGSVLMGADTATAPATATRPTAVTAPVPVRAPYVARTVGSENQRLMCSIFHRLSAPLLARARTAPASSQLSAWLRPTRPRSLRSSVSRLPQLRPRTRPLSLALSLSPTLVLLLPLLLLLPQQARRRLPTQLLPPTRKTCYKT
jgi:hypothetical protein